jgi:hypothetical protein
MPAEERWRMEALVTAYGSPEVLRLLQQWNERARKIDSADATIRTVERSRNPSQQLDDEAQREHLAIEGYKRELFEADKAIRDRMHRELAGEA